MHRTLLTNHNYGVHIMLLQLLLALAAETQTHITNKINFQKPGVCQPEAGTFLVNSRLNRFNQQVNCPATVHINTCERNFITFHVLQTARELTRSTGVWAKTQKCMYKNFCTRSSKLGVNSTQIPSPSKDDFISLRVLL